MNQLERTEKYLRIFWGDADELTFLINIVFIIIYLVYSVYPQSTSLHWLLQNS